MTHSAARTKDTLTANLPGFLGKRDVCADCSEKWMGSLCVSDGKEVAHVVELEERLAETNGEDPVKLGLLGRFAKFFLA